MKLTKTVDGYVHEPSGIRVYDEGVGKGANPHRWVIAHDNWTVYTTRFSDVQKMLETLWDRA